jgi:histidine triad (HIT) family protein
MNLITSSGHEAEQTIFHLHLHLVPRWRDDGFGRIWPLEANADGELESDDTAEMIRQACADDGAG